MQYGNRAEEKAGVPDEEAGSLDSSIEGSHQARVHAYFSGGKIKWQFKRSDEEKWDHEAEPTMEDWESLLHYAEARYRRNRMPYEDIELIKKLTPKHC
jgi:hypothetical protein